MKFLLRAVIFSFFCSCGRKDNILLKHFFDEENRHIGDSIFVNGLIHKIVFIDTSYYIDSIVYSRFNDREKTMKSMHTYENGRAVYENIDYHENGSLKMYSFVDEDNAAFRYIRNYDINGNLTRATGHLFFQGFIFNVDSPAGIEFKRGTTTSYKIYYPNPPDCDVTLFIRLGDTALHDVFSQSRFLRFLQTMSHDNNKPGAYQMDFVLKLTDKNKGTTHYSKSLIYKIVD